MAGVEELYLSIKTDIKNATKDLEKYIEGLKETKKQTKEAGDATKGLTKEQEALQTSLLEDIKSFQVMGVSLNGIQKGFAKIIPTAKLAFSTITKGIMATGVGALVIAFGALVTWFTKTKVGAEALSKIFAGLGAAVDVIVDRITGMVEAVRQMFSGDIMGGLKSLGSQFTGIGAEMTKEIDLAIKLKAELQALVDSERELSVETAKRRAEVESLKLIAEDVTKTEEERLEAAQRAFDLENELLAKRVANAENAVRIQQQQMAMSKNMKEDLQKLADLEINLANIRQESTTKQIELNNKINAIEAQQEAKRIAAHNRRIQRLNEITRANNVIIKEVNAIVEELQRDRIEAMAATELEAQYKLNKRTLDQQLKADEEKIKESKLSAEQKARFQIRIATKYERDLKKIQVEFEDAKKERDETAAAELATITNETTLKLIEDLRKRGDEALRIQEEIDLKAVEGKTNQLELEAAIEDKYRLLRKEKKDAEAEEDKARAEAVAQTKQEILSNGLAALSGALQFQMNDLEKQKKKEIKLAKAQGKDTEAIEKKFEKKRIEIAKKQKALKIGMAVIDTFQSGISAYNSAMQLGPPGLALAPLAAAAAIAAGLANVAIISQQDVGGGSGGGGGGGIPGGGGGGAERPSEQFMGGGFELGTMDTPDPIKAFVVTDEMTNSQNQLANIRRRSTI
jgi:hypothetical protein